MRSRLGSNDWVEELLDDAFHSIFRRAASSIETLFTIAIQGSQAPATILFYPQPNLTNLSVTGNCATPSFYRPFSSLKRIHVTTGLRDDDITSVINLAPALEELRFTGIHGEAAGVLVDAAVERARCTGPQTKGDNQIHLSC